VCVCVCDVYVCVCADVAEHIVYMLAMKLSVPYPHLEPTALCCNIVLSAHISSEQYHV